MKIRNTRGNVKTGLVYDPSVKGISRSFFKLTTGTPTVSSGDLRINNAGIASYTQYLYGEFHFKVKIASSPSSGEAKTWGLQHPATTIGSMYFNIAGAVFSFKSYNEDNVVTSTTVTWDQQSQTWATNYIDYKIVWTDENIKAYVGAILVATHAVGDNNLPQPIRILNEDADNMDVDYIIANKIGSLIA